MLYFAIRRNLPTRYKRSIKKRGPKAARKNEKDTFGQRAVNCKAVIHQHNLRNSEECITEIIMNPVMHGNARPACLSACVASQQQRND
jgi:hypothetical protein